MAEIAEAERMAEQLTVIGHAQTAADEKARQAAQVLAEARRKAEEQLAAADRAAGQVIAEAGLRAREIEVAAHAKAAKVEAEGAAKAEGVEAWADGRLVGPAPDGPTGEKRLVFADPSAAQSSGLVARLSPVWGWLHGWTGRANALVAQRVEVAVKKRLPEAIAETRAAIALAATAWADGLLWRRGKSRADGRPALVVDDTRDAEATALIAKLDPHRETVAEMLDRLPDRQKIAEAQRLATDLAPFASKAEQERAAALSQAMRPSGPSL
jgi:hypothetical protein